MADPTGIADQRGAVDPSRPNAPAAPSGCLSWRLAVAAVTFGLHGLCWMLMATGYEWPSMPSFDFSSSNGMEMRPIVACIWPPPLGFGALCLFAMLFTAYAAWVFFRALRPQLGVVFSTMLLMPIALFSFPVARDAFGFLRMLLH